MAPCHFVELPLSHHTRFWGVVTGVTTSSWESGSIGDLLFLLGEGLANLSLVRWSPWEPECRLGSKWRWDGRRGWIVTKPSPECLWSRLVGSFGFLHPFSHCEPPDSTQFCEPPITLSTNPFHFKLEFISIADNEESCWQYTCGFTNWHVKKSWMNKCE